jgi:predicted ArsR family transcriptional regulator
MSNTDAIAAAASINDPVRRELLDLVAASPQPLSRDAAAGALGLPRSTVAFHLDRLAAAGLLTVEYRRLTGKSGPGSGRPSKTYSRAPAEFSLSIPPRHYDLMGDLLASAIESAADGSTNVFGALRAAAEKAGRTEGAETGSLDVTLARTGYEPHADNGGTVLSNCPFHALVEKHTEVVCSANHAFLCGVAAASGGDPDSVLLDPAPGRCCVRIAG